MTSWLVVACNPDNRKGNNNNNTREQLKTNECSRKLINVSIVE